MSSISPIVKASASSSTATTTTTKTTTTVNMAVPRTTKAKPAAAKAAKANSDTSSTNKQKAQMHRRSRTGCYTCRLRRKKCDEGSPMCTACKHLGLCCEFKRPHWWSNNEARRAKKEEIKRIIKCTKQSEKTSAQHTNMQSSVPSPPGLSHSLPTSATFSDPLDRTRSASVDSHLSFNFNSPPTSSSDYGLGSTSAFSTPQLNPDFMFSAGFPPYDVDIKTERQMYVDNVPTLHESTTSTFSTFHTPPPPGTVLPPYPCGTPGSIDVIDGTYMGAPGMGVAMGVATEGGEWMEQVYLERRESMTEETLNMHFFDFSHGPSSDSRQVAIELDEGDQRLLDHFVRFVLPSIFPILETNQHGSVGSDLILPALQSNKCYLHCCLSIAAQHLKAMLGEPHGSELDGDVMRHRYATISTLCAALPCEENYQQILEATLGMIFFQCSVGRLDDDLPDVSWHQHFQAAVSVVQKLDLPRLVTESLEVSSQEPLKTSLPQPQTPFNMTLTAWIDILGATMQGRAPTFAHTYREKHLSPAHETSLGLRELMGCEDRVMYLISEIACLEALKAGGMDDIMLCQHVSVLGDQIGLTEMGEAPVRPPFNANGTLSPKQLSKNMTAAFRLAARVYLCSLVPGFHPAQPSCIGLVEKLTAVLQMIPCGAAGYDRSVVWVYLMAGAVSVPGSPFQDFFAERIEQMGDQAYVGSFGRVVSLLHEVWHQQDLLQQQGQQPSSPESVGSSMSDSQQQYVHWRDVMQMKGWDFLLI
ncbi:c6 zinc finger domain containing protein [Grosmannia clavigera kw1407]|uniref:C6 zinc finger domain containing protein n=1 Tax=Grosmannia clavigera (strain kw1407 / UAMH 11150) TaxID=655863 RepID=F0XD87_GROCL|nr:c6 zinc finger domain containing protein [Grosmannia clavigera kw1407]EFX04161.1 c6 zinc finger domain containing protein [Grosmannia clavigera kw1407]